MKLLPAGVPPKEKPKGREMKKSDPPAPPKTKVRK
jgi:hypothetical protein